MFLAVISDCSKFRYLLSRTWDESLPTLFVQMLNPSSADTHKNDPTISTLIRFAKAWGFGRIVVVNIFAFRTKDPKKLALQEDPEGCLNDHWITEALQGASAALVAWGNYPIPKDRVAKAIETIQRSGLTPMCMGTTKSGAPKHPLARGKHRIPSDQELITWQWTT